MMMNRITILFPLLMLAFLPASAQKIQAEKTTIDVGRTGWKTPITAVFEFRTKGKVRIESVLPDCSCTKVDYPKGNLSNTFQIKVTYDAKQLGHFDKQVAIKTNASSKPFYLRMRGLVLEHFINLAKHYPVEMGNLRLDKSDLEFDDVNKGDQLVQELRIFNNGTRNYQPNLMHLPPYLAAKTEPELLCPGDTGRITVMLNSSRLRDFGLTQTAIYLAGNPGDKVRSDHEIGVSTVLLPSFTNQVQNPPHIQLSTEKIDVDFGEKSKKTETITVMNVGKSELHISSLQMFTRGLRISLNKTRLQPGEYAKLKVTALRDDLKKVRTKPRILMITNDPAKPKVTIPINVQ